jgi:hypothetical protein
MSFSRLRPPIVAQTHVDSCWAAVLESWSIVDGHIPRQHQQRLIHRWGEGGTGGITPLTKIPVIAAALTLGWGGFPASDLGAYLNNHLPHSHIFCAYSRGAFTHAVLIYRFSDQNNISYMDPNGGHDRWKALDWFLDRGPYVLMRRKV